MSEHKNSNACAYCSKSIEQNQYNWLHFDYYVEMSNGLVAYLKPNSINTNKILSPIISKMKLGPHGDTYFKTFLHQSEAGLYFFCNESHMKKYCLENNMNPNKTETDKCHDCEDRKNWCSNHIDSIKDSGELLNIRSKFSDAIYFYLRSQCKFSKDIAHAYLEEDPMTHDVLLEDCYLDYCDELEANSDEEEEEMPVRYIESK
jgi:hypothetical protein